MNVRERSRSNICKGCTCEIFPDECSFMWCDDCNPKVTFRTWTTVERHYYDERTGEEEYQDLNECDTHCSPEYETLEDAEDCKIF